MKPDLTISLINHSNPELLRDCLKSLESTTHAISLDIRIVDNATDGRLVDEIRAQYLGASWSFNRRRMGFSANHNQVLSAGQGRYVCILNDDTIIHDRAMDELVRFMDQHPRVGMAGPRTLNPNGSIQNSVFRDKTLWSELIEILQLPGRLNGLKARGIDPAQFGEHAARVDWVLGACIIVRKETLQQIGLLDDLLSPIAQVEEVDWCFRARQAGWEVAFVPSAVITHLGGQSMKLDRPGADPFRVEMHRSLLAYFAKHRGLLGSMMLRFIDVATLPWNGFMLAQSVLRGRTSKVEASSKWATYLRIAAMALKPLKRPFCRFESTLEPNEQRADFAVSSATK
jgi:GT2 family glycosyltransferase